MTVSVSGIEFHSHLRNETPKDYFFGTKSYHRMLYRCPVWLHRRKRDPDPPGNPCLVSKVVKDDKLTDDDVVRCFRQWIRAYSWCVSVVSGYFSSRIKRRRRSRKKRATQKPLARATEGEKGEGKKKEKTEPGMKGRNEGRNERKETEETAGKERKGKKCLWSQKRRELVLSALLFSSVCIFFEFCSWCSCWWWCVSFDRIEQDQEVLAEKPWRVRRSLCCRPSSFRDIRVFEEKTRRTRQEVYFSSRGTVWGTSERGSSNNIRPADLKWLHLS